MGWESSHITGRYSYRFNGLDYFETPADTSLNVVNDFSYGFMIKPGSTSTCTLAIRMQPSANLAQSSGVSDVAFHIEMVRGYVQVTLFSASDITSNYGTQWKTYGPVLHPDDISDIEVVWSNVGGVSGDLLIYKNGASLPLMRVQAGSANPTLRAMPTLTGSVVRFGHSSALRNNFNGIVYDIRYTDRARSAEEISDTYEAIKPTLSGEDQDGTIVFTTARSQSGQPNPVLYLMDGRGNNQRSFIHRADDLYHPQWSKHDNGAHVAFSLVRTSVSMGSVLNPNGVYVADGDGGNAVKVKTAYNGVTLCYTPAWSGNGTFIMTTDETATSNAFDVFKISNPLETPTSAIFLTGLSSQERGCDVAWDNTFMVSLRFDSPYEASSEISKHILNPATGALVSSLSIFSAAKHTRGVRISPNNQYIGFSTQVDVGGGIFKYQVKIMNAGGGDIRQLTYFNNDCMFQCFSPDSSRILFRNLTSNGNWQLFTMDIDGQNVRNISNNNFNDYDADWKA